MRADYTHILNVIRHEVTTVAHYWLEVNAMTRRMMLCQDKTSYGKGTALE